MINIRLVTVPPSTFGLRRPLGSQIADKNYPSIIEVNIGITNSRSSRLTNTTSYKLMFILKQELDICIYSVYKKSFIIQTTAWGQQSIQASFNTENNINGSQRIANGRKLFFDGLPSKFNLFQSCGPAKKIKNKKFNYRQANDFLT